MDTAYDDLHSRVAAHLDDGEPTAWTPEAVLLRLVSAFEIVAKTGGRVGPSAFQTAWPSMMRDWSDMVDEQVRERIQAYADAGVRDGVRRKKGRINWEDYVDGQTKRHLQDDVREVDDKRGGRVGSLEIEMADEALAWASRYLGDHALQADALQLWAWCTATDRDMRKILRVRALRADGMAARRQFEEDARRKLLRGEIAKESTAWANVRIATARDAEHIRHIKHNARIKYEREVEKRAAEVCPVRVTRKDVMPGKVFTRRWLDEQRKIGAALLADALRKAGVVIR